MKFSRLEDWLEWQECLHPKGIDLGLERVAAVARRCGLLTVKCPVVTVAGTNGKGSTVALMEAMLSAEGYRVASYTSPHLHLYNERIKVGGELVSDGELCQIFDFIEQQRGDTSLSFFEYGTLAALCHFQKEAPDIVILEVGLGGRLDAVNILDPDVAIITSIDLDHTSLLGSNRADIAVEKAGILRQCRPLVCGDFDLPSVVGQLARGAGANLLQLGKEFDFVQGREEGTWDFVSEKTKVESLPVPALFGTVQYHNASCAIQALELLKRQLPVSRKALEKGLENVRLSGRFELTSEGCTVIRDIAHNPASCAVLAENLCAFRKFRRLHAVFGVLDDKDAHGMVRELLPLVDVWYLGQVETRRAMALGKLSKLVREMAVGKTVLDFPGIGDGYRQAVSFLEPDDGLLIFGSVVTVAATMIATHSISRHRAASTEDRVFVASG